MGKKKKRKHKARKEALEVVREILWLDARPDGKGFYMNKDKSWDSSTADRIARALVNRDYGPEKGHELETDEVGLDS
jgi:hypothetical protein